MLDVTQRLVVIVGGGRVAVRKARGLIDAGATMVRCIAPAISEQMPSAVQRIIEPFDPRHLEGAGLVFAATDDVSVNDQVVAEARRRGVLVNRADGDDELASDFATPAVWRQGSVTLTVSAGGSPALATTIRDELGPHVKSKRVLMADAMQQIRPRIRNMAQMRIEQRRRVFVDLAGDEAAEVLQSEGIEGVLNWLQRRHPEIA